MTARRIAVSVVLALMAMSRSSLAQQEWREFVSKEDFFGCNFPGEPVVTNVTWTTEYGAELPARVYTVTQGPAHLFGHGRRLRPETNDLRQRLRGINR